MKKFLILMIVLLALSSCAMIGASSHYAGYTKKGKAVWENNGLMYLSGNPHKIVYSQKDVTVYINAPLLAEKTYSIGPCLLVPLPVIPIFAIDNTVYNEPLKIMFSIYPFTSSYRLTKANILLNNKYLSPVDIGYNIRAVVDSSYRNLPFFEHYKWVSDSTQLPVLLDRINSYYSLIYDTKEMAVDSFDFEFTLEDAAGTVYLEDKISFRRDNGIFLRCVL